MTIRALRSTTAAAAVLLLVLGVGCSASTDKAGGHKPRTSRVLRVVHTRGAEEAQPFIDKVADLSGGALRLSVDNRPKATSTHSEIDAVRAVQAGKADLAVVSARPWHALGVDSFDALIAPLGIDSMALQRAVLASDIPKHMLAGLEHVGLEGIGLLPGPMRTPAGITRPLVTPADYAGARIGFNQSAVAERSLRTLGAIPIESGFDGTSISAYDGIEQQVSSVAGNQYDGVVHTITVNVNLWPRTLVVIANARTVAGLPQQERSWLHSAATDAVDAVNKAQMDPEQVDVMCRRGTIRFITATPAQLAQLRAAFAPVYSWLRRDRATAHYLDQIDALRGGVTPYPRESPSCAGIQARPTASTSPPAATGPPSPLDGAYELRLSAADLRAIGTPAEDIVPENYGVSRLVLQHGRFALTGHQEPACSWAYGTFLVHADRIRLTFSDGGGNSPNRADAKPGEIFDYRWSVYRDSMQWSAVPNAVSPPGWIIRPWMLLSKAASRKFLDPKCPPPPRALTG